MIDRGLFYKCYRETRTMGLLFCGGLFAFEFFLSAVLPMFNDQVSSMLEMPFIRVMFSAMLGMDLGDSIAAEAMAAFAWVHPAILILIWTQVAIYSVRLPAGEIGRGTFDLILAMPVSRQRIYATHTMLGLAWGILLMVCGVLGSKLGALAFDETGLRNSILFPVVLNLFALYLAVGGISMLVSCIFNRKGSALGLVFGVLIATLILNFLVQLWGPAGDLNFLSLLEYYRPMTIISGAWPVTDMLVLTTIGAVCWLIGGQVLKNKDIPVL
ncbi:MAG: hypothetical protein QNK37_37835 [Acidobacteriota bacterium]|nr:hypothetical protein [Acidobacteriota bacterium]